MVARKRTADVDPIVLWDGAQIALRNVFDNRRMLNKDTIWEAVRAFDVVAQRVADGLEGALRMELVAVAMDATAGYLLTALDALGRAVQAGDPLTAASWPARARAQKAAHGAFTAGIAAARAGIAGETPPVLRAGTAPHAALLAAFGALLDVADHGAVLTARMECVADTGYDPDEADGDDEPTPIRGRRDGGDGGRPGKRGDEHRAIPGTSCYLGDDCIYELRGGGDSEDARRVVLAWRPYVQGSTYIEGDDAGKRVTFNIALNTDGSDMRPVSAPTVKDATCWEHWSKAIGYAGRRERDTLYNTVLMLAGDLPRTIGHNATGWHPIDEHAVYLTGDVCIGADGPVPNISNQLTGPLARYRLPSPPSIDSEEARAALRAAIDLLDVAPLSITAPLFGAAWLAPLSEALGEEAPDFTPWLDGPSGAFKSELSALGQGFYGPFTADTLPTSFADSGPGQEKVLYGAKDAYCAVEDYHPTMNPAEAHARDKTAERLLRAQGNKIGRNLSTREGALREAKPPRCVPVATGEMLPTGHSTVARLFAVPVEPGAVDVARLTIAQERRGELPVAMSLYVRELAAGMDNDGPDGLYAALPKHYRDLRLEVQRADGHARGPGQVAHLYLGLETFLIFSVKAGVLGEAACAALLAEAWQALLTLAADQAAELAGESPVERFLALLGDGFASKRAYLTDESGGAPIGEELTWGWEADSMNPGRYHHGNALRLGVVTAEWLLLIPEETYRYVATAAHAAGEAFPVKLQTLTKRLDEAGMIFTEAGTRYRTVREDIDGKRRRVIKLSRSARAPAHTPRKSVSSVSSVSKSPDLGVDEPDFVDTLCDVDTKVCPQSVSTAAQDAPDADDDEPPPEPCPQCGADAWYDGPTAAGEVWTCTVCGPHECPLPPLSPPPVLFPDMPPERARGGGGQYHDA